MHPALKLSVRAFSILIGISQLVGAQTRVTLHGHVKDLQGGVIADARLQLFRQGGSVSRTGSRTRRVITLSTKWNRESSSSKYKAMVFKVPLTICSCDRETNNRLTSP